MAKSWSEAYIPHSARLVQTPARKIGASCSRVPGRTTSRGCDPSIRCGRRPRRRRSVRGWTVPSPISHGRPDPCAGRPYATMVLSDLGAEIIKVGGRGGRRRPRFRAFVGDRASTSILEQGQVGGDARPVDRPTGCGSTSCWGGPTWWWELRPGRVERLGYGWEALTLLAGVV